MQAFALTDIGKKRQINQDCVFASTVPVGRFQNLFLLADGMGGHRAGDYASRYFIDIFRGFIEKTALPEPVSVFGQAIGYANMMLYNKSQTSEELSGMGTTCVAATIEDGLLTVANVGDSRLYVIHEDTIDQITRDHSLVEELVAMGEIRRGSEEYKKRKNIITKAVGIERDVRADFFDEMLCDGDYVLMCSDGLTNMVKDEDILAVVTGKGGPEYKCRKLIEEANKNGGNDNIGVILVKYEEEGGDRS